MTHLPSLPHDATLLDVFRSFPAVARPLLDYHQVVMRGPSPLSPAQRELLAAYVSGLNACDYCLGVHRVTSEALGVDEGLLTAMLEDLESAPVEARLRPLLRYVAVLTRTPGRVRPGHAAAVLDAGWDEQALHDAASVCGLFNLMNRLVEGLGVTLGDGYAEVSGNRLAEHGYEALKDLL